MSREQQVQVETLKQREWDLCFFGHSLKHELAQQPIGFVAPNADFIWAHCYAVHARVLPRLVACLEQAMTLPPPPSAGKQALHRRSGDAPVGIPRAARAIIGGSCEHEFHAHCPAEFDCRLELTDCSSRAIARRASRDAPPRGEN